MQRKLKAIFGADVQGYRRLMGDDDEHTVNTITTYRGIIAARIENLADPGGICISRGVYDQVEGKLDLGFADLGPHSVKNIEKPELEPASMDRMAYPLPDKPSIAVLPFENYSDDAKLNFFASGLTEDLTASLSKAPDLFVISKSSAATYKGKPIDFKQVAEEQGWLSDSRISAGSRRRLNCSSRPCG